MRSQKPESGTIVGTAKCSQLSELVGGLGGGTSSQKPLSRESATKGTEQSGRRVRRYAEYLPTHGADEEPSECAERSLATHGADDLVIWTSDRTEFRGEFEAKDGSDRPSRLSSRVAVGQAPEAYVRVAKFGVGQEDFIRNPSGS
ncbi:hypothetical protein PR003_g7687 [Phytophthora rubi]|uniref:Uncharacterized protein n=1 Tax=Phytophthora rubi TaxID=129364 RepID=A0A6A3KPR7_9STRA|nr:hypothetical protein PR001_g17030 [Phytophthora rubi]KAE9345949.1 hypothetical protein PR003_g7687 [Phytophthora rubi]